MAFNIVTATAPGVDVSDVSLRVAFSAANEGKLHEATLTFAKAARVEAVSFDFGKSWLSKVTQRAVQNLAEVIGRPELEPRWFNLEAEVRRGSRFGYFSIRNLASNDTLHIAALSTTLFMGNVFHGPRLFSMRTDAPCVVSCADGSSAQGCITCTDGEITVKVCC